MLPDIGKEIQPPGWQGISKMSGAKQDGHYRSVGCILWNPLAKRATLQPDCAQNIFRTGLRSVFLFLTQDKPYIMLVQTDMI